MAGAAIRQTMAECISEAQSGSHVTQQKALQALASITMLSHHNRALLAQTDGAIVLLLALTRSLSPAIQDLSLSILFNLSLNSDLKQSLGEMETIYRLNSVLLSSTSSESTKLVSSLICSLAMLDKNKAKFGVAGTIQLLVRELSIPRHPAAHHLLCSLVELVQFHGNCTVAVRAGAISVLLSVVDCRSEGDDLSGTALSILCLLARFDEGMKALRKTKEIVETMVDVLKGRCSVSKEGAAEILVRLFDESESILREALELPEFPTVVADLSVRGTAKGREKAAWLMKKMTANSNWDTYSNHGIGNSTTLLLY